MLAESGDVEADDIHGLLAEEALEGAGEFGAQGPGAGAGGMCSCLSIAYYRPFFDVDTDEVLGRVRAALLFCHSEPFLRVLRNKPDAYGPWWIATTLIFLISVTSHFKALLSLGDDYEYDFAAVTFSAAAVYTYLGLAAFTSWLCLNYWLKVPMALLNCLCIVGYSLVPYVPASLACVLPYMAWPAVLAGAVMVCNGLFDGPSRRRTVHVVDRFITSSKNSTRHYLQLRPWPPHTRVKLRVDYDVYRRTELGPTDLRFGGGALGIEWYDGP